MKNLFTLVKMQLKEKLNFRRTKVDGVTAFNIFVSIVGAIFKFALITAAFFVLLFAIDYIGIFGSTIPSSAMSIAFGVLLIATLLSCTPFVLPTKCGSNRLHDRFPYNRIG